MLTAQLTFRRKKMEAILQSEVAECGLACLAMILSHYGHRVDVVSLRARFGLTSRGTTLEQLLNFAERLSLVGRPLRLEMDELQKLRTPCILHWRMNHFVVLVRADAKGIEIHDPAIGARRLTFAEIDNCFTGIAVELVPGVAFAPVDERRKVRISALLGKVHGLWRSLAIVFVMALSLEILALLAPMLQQWSTDEALTSNDHDLLNVLACAGLLLMAAQAAISQARGWTLMYLSTNLGLQWSASIFSHLLRLPVDWFEKRHLGDVVSRFGAASTIQHKLTTGYIAAVLDGMMALATLVMMFLYSSMLSAVVLVSVIAYALLRALAYRPFREASVEGMILAAQEQSCFLETIRAIQPIKLAGRELDRRTRWLNFLAESINRSIRTQKISLVFGNLQLALTGIVSALLFRIGAGMVMDGNGSFTIGMLIAFISYSSQFGVRMGNLIDNAIEWRTLSIHCERLADIVLEEAEPERDDSSLLNTIAPRLELANVGFRYGDSEPWVLRHVNLTIEPGEFVALVGPSGGGKSTLVKLILGILKPTEGEIRYGGTPLDQIGTRAYRKVLSAVMQDDQLLSGSLRENISFFDPQPDQRRIEDCARQAAVHNDIIAMPMGYNTLVGDMGSSLSGGQKQRVLLARALYKQPRLLVLDEATSHLDIVTERTVNNAVSSLDITRVIVAHRPETIASALRIVTLSRGAVVEDRVRATT
jgi:ATP-binding cassette subfamily B protein RaxB